MSDDNILRSFLILISTLAVALLVYFAFDFWRVYQTCTALCAPREYNGFQGSKCICGKATPTPKKELFGVK